MRAEAGIALGLYGRRRITLTPEIRRLLFKNAADENSSVRYAVTYALAQEESAPSDEAASLALLNVTKDKNAETRALALLGLQKRRIEAQGILVKALGDEDWRVQVQAARALSTSPVSPQRVHALADWLKARWGSLHTNPDTPQVHAFLEAMDGLAPEIEDRRVLETFNSSGRRPQLTSKKPVALCVSICAPPYHWALCTIMPQRPCAG
ncbi:MAG: HEAT repeat domain-containing protein [Myxococcota bacterium]